MVVPVPWTLETLLKLLTSTSPPAMLAPDGNPTGTKATPYGLTSPLEGTVEELISFGINASAVLPGVAKPARTIRLTDQDRQPLDGLNSCFNCITNPSFVRRSRLMAQDRRRRANEVLPQDSGALKDSAADTQAPVSRQLAVA